MFCVYGIINTSGVFESYLSTHQLINSSPSQIGWIFSVYLFVVFFVGVQAGPSFDLYGPRVLMIAGSLMMFTSLMLLGVCNDFYQFLLDYSILGGLGGALINVPAFASIAHFFQSRRGIATGIASTSGSIGGIVFPILLQHLLPTLGFAWATRILAFIILGLSILAVIFLRSRLPAQKSAHSIWPDLSIFQSPRFAFAAIGIFFMEWGLFVPLTYIVSYAAAHNQSSIDPYALLSILNAGQFFGMILPGLLADHLGRFNIIISTITLCIMSILGLWLPAGDTSGLVIAFVVIFGFAGGSNLGLIPVCVGQLCDARDYGRYYGTAMMAASFGTLTSVPIGGALLGIGDNGWLGLMLFSGLSYVVALGCYISVRILAVGMRIKAVF
ncbi:major facilitator superfamily domain-containing protein [Xylariaceae sp. FL0662B]|nr:major facilitator superfamily domain-containing protein [Xylariaceae sp. FL0662B]